MAAIEEHGGNLETSFRWFIKALDIVETSRSRLTDVADRRDVLNVIHSAELFAGLARLSLRFHASQGCEGFGRLMEHWVFHGPTWEDEALLFLEQGRARALLDLLTPEGMSDDFLEWSYQLRREELGMRAEEMTDAGGGDGDLVAYLAKLRRNLRGEIESPGRAMILARLHRPHFASDARRIYESIPDDALVVHMNPSRDGVLVLYISRKGVELARPSSLADQRMERHVLQYLKLFKKVEIDELPSKAKCQALLEELSDEIMHPARKLIDGKSHLIFVPSQSLNKFPFSALLLDGEPLFLQKDVTQVRAPRRAAVIDTHGLQSDASAWKSSIELRQPLQVLELVRLRSRAALVVFEACVSGVGEGSLGNDVLGFAQSVLSLGAGAFLGAMWNVSDMASAMLMSFLFRELTAPAPVPAAAAPATATGAQAPAAASSLAACLRRAQIRLYRTHAPTAKAVLEDFRAASKALDPAHINPSHLKKILNTLNALIEGEDGLGQSDFSHPFFWAPFVLVGHGAQRLENLAL